jgi:fibro-slime domain-containing protein
MGQRFQKNRVRATTTLLVVMGVAACGNGVAPREFDVAAGPATGTGSSTGTAPSGATSATTGGILVPPEAGVGGANGNPEAGWIVGTLPPDFVKTEAGGYKLGPAITGSGVSDTGLGTNGVCNEVVGVVRDFIGFDVGGHPDFQRFSGEGTKGLVGSMLGSDGKPVYTGICESSGAPAATCPYGQETTGKANFDAWYRFTDGVNKPYLLYFFLQTTPGESVVTFNSQYFFPVDGAGWQTPGALGADVPQLGDDGQLHNFNFTSELHTKFRYTGGETFRFEGDDDLWVFVDRRLVIDLGGVHSAEAATISLDTVASSLGLSKTKIYSLDLFQAERHTTGSHFHFETTLSFVDCGSIPPDMPR